MKSLLKIMIMLLLVLAAGDIYSQAYTWVPLGNGTNNGTNGNIYAAVSFSGKMVCGGSFTMAGGNTVSNIAAYDVITNQWSAMGSISGQVKALTVYNNELYAGGQFFSPGNNIVKWNGTSWQPLGQGTNGEVSAFTIYNGELAVGGNFDMAGGYSAKNVARWNGSGWGPYGSGLTGSGDRVNALTVFSGNLVAGGRFDIGSFQEINVAKWNGSGWTGFNNSEFEDDVQALKVFNGELYVGGKFEYVQNTNSSKYIVKWSGSAWQSVGGGVNDGDVEALEVYKNSLVVGGNFRVTGSGLYVDRIAQWTGSQWQRMLSGMNDRVYSLFTFNGGYDTIFYAAGEFTSAGGKWSYHAAKWGSFSTSTVSGTVRREGSLNPVTGGKVKAIRYDVVTREVIVIDSAVIDAQGNYTLPKVPKIEQDGRIIAFPDDEDNPVDTSFVPTYYPSALLWNDAYIIDPQNNLTNINITVKNRSALSYGSSAFGITGSVFLNIVLPPVGINAVPYWKNSLIYIEQNGNFVTFTQSNEQQGYSVAGLNPGTYTMRVTRLGYETETRQVTVSSQNLVENFTLDTMNLIGITPINMGTPDAYTLKQNYPNPFNPVTNIEFSMPKHGFASLRVYDILGKEVAELVNNNLKAGVYSVDFNASVLPSGVYFYRLQTDSYSETRKMMLIK